MALRSNRAASPPPEGNPEIWEQVERILRSSLFSRSLRLHRFLRFGVKQSLEGKSEELKEQLVGVEVFDRKADYDPRTDPIVRVEARRLREKLKLYYAAAGRHDRLVIEFPRGTYAPVFRNRRAVTAPIPKRTGHGSGTARSIVVLPFTNLAPELNDDYFSDGLIEELIHFLTRIPGFRVVAWNSASKLRGREQDLPFIRQQLKVETVLRGSVRRTDGHVRVAAQLIDAQTGIYLWSEPYERELQNVFAIQEEMAQSIVLALHLKLASPMSGRHSPSESSLTCYQLCLQGRFHANKRTPEGLRKSVVCFEQATAADESSAEAYTGLADAHSLLADYGLAGPSEAMPKARAAAERALELNPESAEANVSLAFIRSLFDWKWSEAEALYRRAISFNPGYAQAHHWFGLDFLALLGRFDEAIAELETAYDLDPLSLIIREGCGYVQLLRRNYAKAVATYRELIDLDPTFYKGYSSLGRAYYMMENFDDALASFEMARRLAGGVPSVLGGMGQTLGRLGRTREARQCLEQLQALAQTQWVPAACLGMVYLGLADSENALLWFETALERKEISAAGFKIHPVYDPLRAEPRFQKAVERMQFLR